MTHERWLLRVAAVIYTAVGRASPGCKWISISRAFLTCAVPGGLSLCHSPSCLSCGFSPCHPQAEPWPRAAHGQSPPSSPGCPEEGKASGSCLWPRDEIRDELSDLVNHWPPENVHCDVILQFHLRVNTLLLHAWLCNFRDRSG